MQEDVDAVVISSYQGGHLEFFRYLLDSLSAVGCGDTRVFGGGGGVITEDEIKTLHDYGVTRIYSAKDGQRMGLRGMIDDMLRRCDRSDRSQFAHNPSPSVLLEALRGGDKGALARLLSLLSDDSCDAAVCSRIKALAADQPLQAPVIGITGVGGCGKSSLTDELLRRFMLDGDAQLSIAILAVDPSRRRSGGALLGDRIRMNAIESDRVFMRSLATRASGSEIPAQLTTMIAVARLTGFGLIIVETPGIGQGDAAIASLVDLPLYVMTPEFGAPSQLEKIDMLDFAAIVAINKFDRRGAEDALHEVRKQLRRHRQAFALPLSQMPVFGTIAARFNDDGISALYGAVAAALHEAGFALSSGRLSPAGNGCSTRVEGIVPAARSRYLEEIAVTVRKYHQHAGTQAQPASSRTLLLEAGCALPAAMDALIAERDAALDQRSKELLRQWPLVSQRYRSDTLEMEVRGRALRQRLKYTTLSGSEISRIALPRYSDDGDVLHFLLTENLPGCFPFTAGVFALKRESETPSRMFAGEGDAMRTNRRFKLLSEHAPAKRLSTAFDSVTLYAFDPSERQDIYGKVGNSGVSIATLDDMKALYHGFDLCAPETSVSMTINGPAPTILAMFLNAAIDQQVDRFAEQNQRQPTADGIPRAARRCVVASARHGTGRHPQRGSRAKYLYLFDRVLIAGDGRYPAMVYRQPGAQILLGVDFWLSHRRGRRQPHYPARFHPRQWLYLCRELSGAGHEGG